MNEMRTMEILKAAILLERRGKAFYLKVARHAENKDIRVIFEIMVEEEDDHIRILNEQFRHFTQTNIFKSIELSNRKNNTAIDILSEKIKRNISAASFEAAAIAAAIDMENRAIAIYTEQADAATDSEERIFYRWLAKWEKGHRQMLIDLDRELKEKVWNDQNFWPQ